MAARQMRGLLARINLVAMEELANAFWAQLPILWGVGVFLLVGGVLTEQAVSDRYVKGLGRAAADAGWKMVLLAAAIHLLSQALGPVSLAASAG